MVYSTNEELSLMKSCFDQDIIKETEIFHPFSAAEVNLDKCTKLFPNYNNIFINGENAALGSEVVYFDHTSKEPIALNSECSSELIRNYLVEEVKMKVSNDKNKNKENLRKSISIKK